LTCSVSKAVNKSLTLRNWLIGFYIDVFELNGEDRANYGDNLFLDLSNELKEKGVSNSGKRQLYQYVKFYKTYPGIVRTLSAQFKNLPENNDLEKMRTLSTQSSNTYNLNVFEMLSYSHFDELCNIDDDMKRMFYEFEAVTGNWSVRELKRQIGSLYYERSGLSKDKHKLSEYVKSIAETNSSKLTVRDPFVFEFLGLKSKEVMYESNLEDAILDNLQNFLLELGHGFCFEARQKRILIGGEHYFIDLLFFNFNLNCYVVFELKAREFSPKDLGQLQMYLMATNEVVKKSEHNPSIGILVCRDKDRVVVEYLLNAQNQPIGVATYNKYNHLKELPNEIARYLPSKDDILKRLELFSIDKNEKN
ncbi:MAG: PDDEXK nuclease domain-containing protein, partial [bacterium]|jgi:predicted nuclease of restriction endonuclease-like (RecB) superfamily|nr:PDDEXK nuclease domain-containing protein [bacterium]